GDLRNYDVVNGLSDSAKRPGTGRHGILFIVTKIGETERIRSHLNGVTVGACDVLMKSLALACRAPGFYSDVAVLFDITNLRTESQVIDCNNRHNTTLTFCKVQNDSASL
ncbi:MAG: hypothetical protein KFH87_02655, partial [Bacteroidetes bacterium]|nr:hypothetical protein [Bacteroidota bacterium]